MIQTSMIGVVTNSSSQAQKLIDCVSDSFVVSTSTNSLPSFLTYVDAQSDWNQNDLTSASYIKNKPSLAKRSQSSANRSLNSSFLISNTQDCLVIYSVLISCSLSRTTGQSGIIYLEIASDIGFTKDVQELARSTNENSGTIVGISDLVQSITNTMSGYVPSNYYCRLRTSNILSTPTFTYQSGQEILL